ncbi:MAG: transglycosylase domain-containing protein [Pseudobacteriovorax sp.]|nr:transglycosylase domain-containing protein [Pseudobacteriovorax sp.]
MLKNHIILIVMVQLILVALVLERNIETWNLVDDKANKLIGSVELGLVQKSKLVDINGQVLTLFGTGEGRGSLNINHAPQHVLQAFISAEDKDFFSHWGVSISGLVRAFWSNLFSQSYGQGGSTITQQLVKLRMTDRSKTLLRKFREILLAIKVEGSYDKSEILEAYLNTIYFGNGCYGIVCASKAYFQVEAEELSLEQAALLAAIIKAPSRMSLRTDEGLAKAMNRKRYVLRRMMEDNYTPQHDVIKLPELKPERFMRSSHAVDYVMGSLSAEVQDASSFGEIQTSLDLKRQQQLENLLRSWKLPKGFQAAGVIINPASGELVAMTGSKDYRKSKFNRATNSSRNIGSLMGYFLSAIALDQGIELNDPVGDQTLLSVMRHRSLSGMGQLAQELGLGTISNYMKSFGIQDDFEHFGFLHSGVSMNLLEVTLAMRNLAYPGTIAKITTTPNPQESLMIHRNIVDDQSKRLLMEGIIIGAHNHSVQPITGRDLAGKNRWVFWPGNHGLLGLWIGSEKGNKSVSEPVFRRVVDRTIDSFSGGIKRQPKGFHYKLAVDELASRQNIFVPHRIVF